jgi:hypothetical protein
VKEKEMNAQPPISLVRVAPHVCPGDPFAGIISGAIAVMKLKLMWLQKEKPGIEEGRLVRSALFGACIVRVSRALDQLQNWGNTRNEEIASNALSREIEKILDWIDESRWQKLSEEAKNQREDAHFEFLLFHGVPLHNALIGARSTTRHQSRRPSTIRPYAILGLEERLKYPGLPWEEIAQRAGWPKAGSLRITVEGKGGLQELLQGLAIVLPMNKRRKGA